MSETKILVRGRSTARPAGVFLARHRGGVTWPPADKGHVTVAITREQFDEVKADPFIEVHELSLVDQYRHKQEAATAARAKATASAQQAANDEAEAIALEAEVEAMLADGPPPVQPEIENVARPFADALAAAMTPALREQLKAESEFREKVLAGAAEQTRTSDEAKGKHHARARGQKAPEQPPAT